MPRLEASEGTEAGQRAQQARCGQHLPLPAAEPVVVPDVRRTAGAALGEEDAPARGVLPS